ncbi:MAG: aldolase [Proteobacteria bacterium]|nr:aldolase [Pseudomonadota bacterium]
MKPRTAAQEFDTPEIWRARVDLAACLRMAARLGFGEGICNHFSALVPGRKDCFMVNPLGYAFAEITASRLLICDFEGQVLAGEGTPEDTAFFIHGRLHRMHPRATAAFHTHMVNATALAMTEGAPFSWSLQSSLKFYGRIAVDPHYNGLAHDITEGDRIAAVMGGADIAFLRNHGVMVCGPSIAAAWDDLYFLERAAEAEVRALSTGRRMLPVSPELAKKTATQMHRDDAQMAALHLESIKRQLAGELPPVDDVPARAAARAVS